MLDKTLDELMNAPTPKTFVSEAIDFEVDFTVREETAEERPKVRLVVSNEWKEGKP